MTSLLSGIRNSYCTHPKRFPASLPKNSDRCFHRNSVTRQFHIINTIIIAHTQLYNITKMGSRKSVESDRVKKAAELRLNDSVLIVPEAILAVTPHFQVSTKATARERETIQKETFKNFYSVRDKF